MDVSTHFIASHFQCWAHTRNLAFCAQFESQPWQKLYHATHKWLPDAIRWSSHLSYTPTEAFELLQQQLSLILVVYHSLSYAERVPPNLVFCANLRVNRRRNNTMSTIRVSRMLFKAPPSFLCILEWLWNTSMAINGSPYSTASHFMCW